MLNGHGDDIFQFADIEANFSSNVVNTFNHEGLFKHLNESLASVRNYPDPTACSLERALSANLGIDENNIMVTNGATEAIYLIAQAFGSSISAIVEPTFAEYNDACRLHNHSITHIGSLSELPPNCRLAWICNPNNPTGQLIPLDVIMANICHYPDTIFVIDCSYACFTSLPQLQVLDGINYPNVLQIHSMTKLFAIPGLRVGYLTGNAKLLDHIQKHRIPWSVNQLAIEAGKYLVEHVADYQIDLQSLQKEVEYVRKRISRLEGFEVLPTDTHILLARTKWASAKQLKDYLANEHKLLIRDASNFYGLDHSYFRIAVQQHSDNIKLTNAIEQWTKCL